MFSFPFVELSVSKTSNEDCAGDTEAETEAESPPLDDPKRCLNIWLLTGDESDNCELVLRGDVLDKKDGVPGEVFAISEAESYMMLKIRWVA